MIRTYASVFIGFVAGLVTATLWPKPKRKPVVHLRGSVPGEYADRICEACRNRPAEYIDQATRSWCGAHLPHDVTAVERAVAGGNGYSDAECTVHGMDCPKAWSYVFK